MSLNLSALKKGSSKELLNKLQKNIEDSKKTGNAPDERFWRPTIDAAGNGGAVIRFLPARTEEDFPFVQTFRHSFQENGKWFIAECPTTIKQPCPCCDANSKLWATKIPANENIARSRKRNMGYIANILVIRDPANPENEGKVKLFRFGKKIFDKVNECFSGDVNLGIEACNPFGFFDGANFNLKIKTVKEFLNYDSSAFVPAKDLYDGDEDKLVGILEQLHDLNEFVAPSLYKSYDELNTRFLNVIGEGGTSTNQNRQAAEKYNQPQKESAPEQTQSLSSTTEPVSEGETGDGGDDDDMAFFRSLANK